MDEYRNCEIPPKPDPDQHPNECATCRGTGMIPHPDKDDVLTCPSCGGTGLA